MLKLHYVQREELAGDLLADINSPLQNDSMRLIVNATTGLACLFALVLISRLPFLDAGYGVNIDAWRVARVARDIATSGEYVASRLPGYPLQEITCALFWRGGPVALNGLTALFSAIAATAFAAIVRKLGCRHWFLAGLALAATPIFFVSSVCSKDYIWALGFVLLSFLYALNQRPRIAGVFLGIATGCRITSLAMALPIALVILGPTPRWRAAFKFGAVAIIVGLLAFSPVWWRYGTNFFTFYGNHARPDWSTIFTRATFEVWGGLGIIGLGLAVIGAWLARKQSCPTNWPVVASLALIIAIYIVAYLRLPDQAGYLLPIVPATLLLVCLFTAQRWLQTALCFFLCASIIDLTPTGLHPGAIFVDHQQRVENLINIRDFLQITESVPGNNIFVVGASEPEIAVLAPHLQKGRNHYVYLMNATEAKAALDSGRSLYCLPVIRAFNYQVNGVDLAKYRAVDLRRLRRFRPLSNGQP